MVETGSEAPSLLAQILAKRHLSAAELRQNLDNLPDESLLANIDIVADRIRKAMFKNEPLVILGHDDPDGITSTYILYHFFNSCGYQRHRYYIPNRNLEPHGIQDSFVAYVKQHKYRLVITVDNGISSSEGVRRLNELGCEVIIVDHHLIQPEQLPEAYAILNPQLAYCQYPFKNLAGVGVVLMLIRYLGRLLEHPIPLSAYFWTAVGSLADKVPMTGANRIIFRHLLEHWNELSDPSVDFLQRNYHRISNQMDSFNFVQNTARLIANGRKAGGQHTALQFLLQMGDEKARLFQKLEHEKQLWEIELNRVFAFLDKVSADFNGSAFTYFDDEDVIPYHLLGTAATYILSNLGIPTLMLKIHNGSVVCEGRCAEGFNMVDAFTHCKEHLRQYGGHVRAAGFTMDPDHYDGFLECYNEYLVNQLPHHTPALPPQEDARLRLQDFNLRNWQDLELLLPFGQQNSEPVIMISSTSLAELQQLFSIEYNSADLPPGKRGKVLLNWKSPQSIRILSFQETSGV